MDDPLQSTTRNGKTCRRTVVKSSVPVVALVAAVWSSEVGFSDVW